MIIYIWTEAARGLFEIKDLRPWLETDQRRSLGQIFIAEVSCNIFGQCIFQQFVHPPFILFYSILPPSLFHKFGLSFFLFLIFPWLFFGNGLCNEVLMVLTRRKCFGIFQNVTGYVFSMSGRKKLVLSLIVSLNSWCRNWICCNSFAPHISEMPPCIVWYDPIFLWSLALFFFFIAYFCFLSIAK